MSAFELAVLWLILALLVAIAAKGIIWATRPTKTMLDEHYRELEED